MSKLYAAFGQGIVFPIKPVTFERNPLREPFRTDLLSPLGRKPLSKLLAEETRAREIWLERCDTMEQYILDVLDTGEEQL